MRLDVSAWAVIGMMLGFAQSLLAQDGVKPEVEGRPGGSIQDPEKKQDDGTLRFFWKDGFKFETGDKAFKGQIAGRIQLLHTWQDSDDTITSDGAGDPREGTEFRRVYLTITGTVYESVEFKVEMDFAASGLSSGDRPGFADTYIRLKGSPVGDITVGHFKEPFSLEELTSDLFITFVERSLHSVFVPARNTGIQLNGVGLEERLTWAFGFFREANGVGDLELATSEGKTQVTSRVTFLPLYENKGETLIHVGLGLSRRTPDADTIPSLTPAPDTHVSGTPTLASGPMAAESFLLVGFEAAAVLGPLSAQAEFVRFSTDAPSGGADIDYHAFCVQLSYFLTGERRLYKTSAGTFDRVKPQWNAFREGGAGAVEAAIRFDEIDFTDNGEGKLSAITVGVNWILNPNTRIRFNYVLSDFEPDVSSTQDGNGTHITLMFQFDF